MDVCILGIGPDGHICSIFPNAETISVQKDIVLVENSPKPPPNRVSVTPHFLNKCQHLYFFIPKRNVPNFYREPHESIMAHLKTQITVFSEND